jgi:SAM-dependent methyltransferase
LQSGKRRDAETRRGVLKTDVRDRAYIERWYPEVKIGGYTHVDGIVFVYTRVNSVLESSSVLLDLGCGRGAATEDPLAWRRELQTFRGRCARVIGADVDPAAADNPLIDRFCLIEDGRLPLSDESVDICVSDAVLEHVNDVELFLAECRRVLKQAGYLFVRTPNARNYASIATRLIPNRLHKTVLARVQPGRKEEDIFPTLYRCNTKGKLLAALDRHGFDAVVETHEPDPAYLSFTRLTYALGVFHQRFAPHAIRRTLLAYARKR